MTWLGAQRHHLASCGSTSDEAARLARDGAPHGAIVTADAQTAGRGRAGRTWVSPPGANLYLSIVLRPAIAPAAAPGLTLAAGIGVRDAVGLPDARLKWPNDVLVGDRKLAGILTEMTTKGAPQAAPARSGGGEREARAFRGTTRDAPATSGRHVIDSVILGIGVNLGSAPPYATSVRAEGGDPAGFLDRLLATLAPWLDRFFAGGVAAIAEDWTARADLTRRVTIPAGTGTPRRLDRDGALIVALDDGGEARVVAGDVVEI